jgi:ABC-type multidrug transport system ATPase subunit
MSDDIVRLAGVSKRFGSVEAVRGATFALRRSALTGFLGENGAGKTTTIKLILGFLKPDAGAVDRGSERVGYVPEQPAFCPWLTGARLLELTARAVGLPLAELRARARFYGRILNFDEALLARTIRTYSLGNHKKFSYLQSLILDPDLLIVDEPFAALDPVAIKRVRDLFLDLKARGRTMLLSSHLISELEKVCDDVVIIRRGDVVFQGELRSLRAEGRDLESLFLEFAGGESS